MHFFSICSTDYIAFININQIYSHTNTVRDLQIEITCLINCLSSGCRWVVGLPTVMTVGYCLHTGVCQMPCLAQHNGKG